jgi:NADH:ubiquinone oxidoreductase subunit F (NADH-binding)
VIAPLLPDKPVVSLEAYLEGGGGRGLERALALDPAALVDEVERSGLRGRGGAGFPTGRKWRSNLELAAEYGAPVYLVANGAEGEPGTYKDRPLLAHNPFAFVEGLLIARHALGAAGVFVGIKEKFAPVVARLRSALAQAAGAGWPGAAEVEVVEGPDEYLFARRRGCSR